ncbi:MAG: class I SAM-dependent methyltransferase [Robiginitalea sp.]
MVLGVPSFIMENHSFKAKDHLVSGAEFDIVWNENKKCFQTLPVPEDMELYYDSPDYISHSDGETTLMDKIYQRAKKANLAKKFRLVERCNRGKGVLMDVGAGTGQFVRYAQERDWEAYGVEPNDQARELAHQKGVSVYKSLSVQKAPVYDVVTLWHVLEHMADLDKNIREIYSVLKPGGWLILALPNYRSLDAKHYKSHWAAYDVPRHLWHFSKESVEQLFSDAGFELKSVKPLWLDAFYISWLSETYKQNKFAPLYGFALGLASNIAGIFTREYSSHVYILQKAGEPV